MSGTVRALIVGGVLAAGAAALAAYFSTSPNTPALDVSPTSRPDDRGPAMCPWREPAKDMQALFPGATGYHAETVVLSRHRLDIVKKLGTGYRMETTALYLYRVEKRGGTMGTIMVRRAAGPHGAIEVVAGIVPEGRVAGVRIQRHREPGAITDAITSSQWLASFKGKTADASFKMGVDLVPVAADALEAANTVAAEVHALLVEQAESDPAAHHAPRH